MTDARLLEFQKALEAGMPLNSALSELHHFGVSIIEAIRMVRETLGIPLTEAKRFVTCHDSWGVNAALSEILDDAMLDLMEDCPPN